MSNNNVDSKALKSGVWYVLCNFLVKGAIFITTPLFARLMTKRDIGLFSNISATVNILMIVVSLELSTSITFAKFEYEERLDEYLSSVMGLSLLISCVLYPIVLVFRTFFMDLLSIDFVTLNIIFLYCMVSPALQMIQVKNRVLFQYKASSALTIGSVLLSVGAALVLVLLGKNKLMGRVVGYYGTLIVFNAILIAYILMKGRRVRAKYWKPALAISVPMIIHLLSGQLLSQCDRLMITRICGAEKNALYTIAYTCATIISVLWNSLNTAWSPWAYDQMSSPATQHRLKSASKPYILFFAVIIHGFLMFAPELLLIMGGRDYLEVVDVIPPVVIGMFFQFVYSLYVNIEFFHKKQRFTAIGTTVAALLNIFLNWLLIPRFGYVAAAYTTLAGYVALFFIHFFIVSQMQLTGWYDTKYNLGMLAGSLALIPICSLLYRHNAVRWTCIALLLIGILGFCLRNRQKLMEAIQKRSLKGLIDWFLPA